MTSFCATNEGMICEHLYECMNHFEKRVRKLTQGEATVHTSDLVFTHWLHGSLGLLAIGRIFAVSEVHVVTMLCCQCDAWPATWLFRRDNKAVRCSAAQTHSSRPKPTHEMWQDGLGSLQLREVMSLLWTMGSESLWRCTSPTRLSSAQPRTTWA